MKTERKHTDLRLYVRLLREVREYWWHIGGLFVLGLLATPVALLLPLPLKICIDSVIDSHPLPGFLARWLPQVDDTSKGAILAFAAVFVIVLALLDQSRGVCTAMLGAYTGEKLLLSFRARLFGHVQRLSLAYHDTRGTSDSLYRIQYDTYAINWIALEGFTPLVSAGFTLAGMIYVTARIDWLLALIAFSVCPLLVLTTIAARRRLRSGWEVVKELESSAIAVVQEVLGGLRVVKAFGQEHREEARFFQRSDLGRRARLRVALVDEMFGLAFAMTTAVGTAAVLWIGVRGVLAQRLTAGDLLLVMGYLSQLYQPAKVISKTINKMQSTLASADRVFTLLDAAPDVVEKPHARPLSRAAGAIAFHNVSFAYDRDEYVLRNVSFEVPGGKRIGIVGTTGAGKTTLLSLLSRFYDPAQGQILLDGIDLREYRLADLRRQYGIVLQEPVLFSTTIAENIAYARPEATEAEIIAAARAAHAHEFISRLPEAYNALVGERGMRLSGGERQRISLARAFLKNAPILILDEPTSSVDAQTEALIMDATEHLMQDRTTLLITHRPAPLARCDLVLKIDKGRVAKAAPLPPEGLREMVSGAR